MDNPTLKNQLNLTGVLSKLWQEISQWFTSTSYFNEDSFVIRLRYFQILSFSFLFVASFLNFLSNSGYGYIITSALCMALMVARFLIDGGKYKKAYVLMLTSIYAGLILLTFLEGLRSGVFLLFLPVIISFSFLADLDNSKDVRLTYLTGIGSFLLAVIIAPDSFLIAEMQSSLYTKKFFFNTILSVMMVAWMSYAMAKENSRKQNILINKEVFLDTIFNSSMHTEIVVDAETGRIINCNEHADSMFASPDKVSLIERDAVELFYELQQKQNKTFLDEVLNTERNWKGELTCIRMDGSQFPASTSFVTFRYHDKYYKKITVADITEKNNILSELQVAKKKAEESASIKSQFLSHMSHELRTPLNGIIGSTNLLLQDKFLAHQREQLNILKFTSEHMMNLINDILDLSKLEADRIQLEKTGVDIPDFIRKVSMPFLQQFEDKGVSLDIIADPSVNKTLLADPTRLNQVLTNLISNAYKFTDEGSVKVQVKAVSLGSDYHTIEFSVTDSGIGISEDKQNQIFEQFRQADVKTTRKYGGTGLGLTISQKLVRLMGGELKVESKMNKGSRFYFQITLPVQYDVKKMYNEKDVIPPVNDLLLKNMRLLVAEDNPINMMIVTRFLDKWEIKYQKAKNGLEAVSLFKNNTFDLLLMDLEMPEMDGYGALKEIRKINADIPAIAFTAAVFDNMKESLISSGFDDYLQKPFRPEDLHARLVSFSGSKVKRA